MAPVRLLWCLCTIQASLRPHNAVPPGPTRPAAHESSSSHEKRLEEELGSVSRPAFPAFASLPGPPTVAATPRTDLSNATEPCILTGLVDAFEGIPDDLLTTTGGKVRVDVWPVDGGPCPAKAGGIIIGPTLVPVAADRVLPLLRHKERGYHAYIRHLDLNSFPDVAARLPLKRARQLCGPRI